MTEGVEATLATIAEWDKRPELGKLTSVDEPEYAAASLDVLLRYIYAEPEKKGWDFFDENYKLSDKQEIKRDIENKLRGCAIYKYLYRRGN